MRASAPGKLVLSGAYAVLRGAKAIVTAVDARVFADSARPSEFASKEVFELLALLAERTRDGRVSPHIDASALRRNGEKLGLGSSAAITVASLLALAPDLSPEEVLRISREAHRIAQGGGSGIDVLAATLGGTHVVTSGPQGFSYARVTLPALDFEVWALPNPATTSDFVRRVFALESSDESNFSEVFGEQYSASEATAAALLAADALGFVRGLKRQFSALSALGVAANVPIVTEEIGSLALLCEDDAALLPAGAGGGDIVLHVGTRGSSREFRQAAARFGLFQLELGLDAQGARLEKEQP